MGVGGWLFVTPQTGWQAYGVIPEQMRVFTGTLWVNSAADPLFENLAGVCANATADATNKLSVASEAVLFNHAGASHQLKLNKASSTDTASLLFQSNWSGRAEMGLAGNDDFGHHGRCANQRSPHLARARAICDGHRRRYLF